MILTSANTLENKQIKEYKGLVTGEALIGANIYKDLFSGVRDVVGGRTSNYEKEIKKARDIALQSMEEKAEQLDAHKEKVKTRITKIKNDFFIITTPYFNIPARSSSAFFTASGSAFISLAPAIALSGLPPPEPPASFATSLARLPE